MTTATFELTEALDRYVELTSAKKVIEAEMKELSAGIIAEAQASETLVKWTRGEAVISLKTRKNWQYSEAVALLKNQVKAKEKEEQIKGIATYGVTKYLSVTGL